MSIHLKPVTFELRGYENTNADQAYTQHDPFRLGGRVTIIGDHLAVLSMFHGKMTRQDVKDLYQTLADMGIKQVVSDRRGMPSSRKVAGGPLEGWNLADLEAPTKMEIAA